MSASRASNLASFVVRIAIVTDVGHGMRWTRQRRKTSGADPPSLKLRRDRYQDPRVASAETGADGEVVWS
jgi:hypothetical protein